MAKIKTKDTTVNVVQVNNMDYICLTDMIKAQRHCTAARTNPLFQ
jgi:hypothetical protein